MASSERRTLFSHSLQFQRQFSLLELNIENIIINLMAHVTAQKGCSHPLRLDAEQEQEPFGDCIIDAANGAFHSKRSF